MFTKWIKGEGKKLELTVYSYDDLGKDPYILDNAIRISSSLVVSKNEKYILYVSPDPYLDVSDNPFKKVAYPVIFEKKLKTSQMLENSRIRQDFHHEKNRIQIVELHRIDVNKLTPIKSIEFQITSFFPSFHHARVTLDKNEIIPLIHDLFTKHNFPFSLGQVLTISHTIDDPRSYMKGAKVDLQITFKIIKINGEKSTKEKAIPVIYQLNNKTKINLTTALGLNVSFDKKEEKPAERKASLVQLALPRNNKNKEKIEEDVPEPEPLSNLIEPAPVAEPETQNGLPPNLSLDFTRCGIGGNKEVLREIVTQVFYSRALGKFAESYEAKPVKAVLLYGPPGTGKTSIASAIAASFPKHRINRINGPELRTKFVGESEAKLRRLFDNAKADWELWGKESPLHVFIFDEIESVFPPRGLRTGGTGVDDNMTSQMLGILDGLDKIENILVFGTTNRPELLDDALKRENRFALRLEIGLPNRNERREIFNLKVKSVRQSKLLKDDVDLDHWADKTRAFSGAEIDELVRRAKNYAQARNFVYDGWQNTLNLKEIAGPEDLSPVTNRDFEEAFKNIKPLSRIETAEFNFYRDKFILYNQPLLTIINEFQTALENLNENAFMHQFNFLLTGGAGVGKTDLIKYLAENANYDYMKLITVDSLLGKTLPAQLNTLEEAFLEARRADSAVIILDNLEGILSASGDGLRRENPLVLKLISLLSPSKSQKKCLIVASSQEKESLERIRLLDCFEEKYQLFPLQIPADLEKEAGTALSSLAKSLKINLTSSSKPAAELPDLYLPIKQVLYLLKKLSNKDQSIDYTLFYKTVKASLPARERSPTVLPDSFFKEMKKAKKEMAVESSLLPQSGKRAGDEGGI